MDFSTNPLAPAIAAVIPGKTPVTNMKYHEKGRRLYIALEAEARLQVIDCLNGKAEHAAPLKCEREQICATVCYHAATNNLRRDVVQSVG